MSTIVIVSVCAAIAAVIGLRVYFEHKQEKELEDSTKEDVFSDLQSFVINPIESEVTPVAIEEKTQNEPITDTPPQSIIEVEPINSTVALTETKPKKKRYYPKKKKAAIKAKPKNQNKK